MGKRNWLRWEVEGIDGRFMDKVSLYDDYFFMVGGGGGGGRLVLWLPIEVGMMVV